MTENSGSSMPRLSCNYTVQRFFNSQKISSCTYLCILLWTLKNRYFCSRYWKLEFSCHFIYLFIYYFITVVRMAVERYLSSGQAVKFIKAIKSPKVSSFTFSKDVQWAGLVSLPGRFWAADLLFDTPSLKYGATDLLIWFTYPKRTGKKCTLILSHFYSISHQIVFIKLVWYRPCVSNIRPRGHNQPSKDCNLVHLTA